MFNLEEKTDSYYHFKDGEKEILVPSTSAIIVDDNDKINVLKTTSCRKNVLIFEKED